MDFGALSPEVNSARMYAGPGPASLREAAVAWDAVAAELRSAAGGYRAVIARLVGGAWRGPTSVAMAAAAAPYAAWLMQTAGQAEQTAGQAHAAASAFATAFAETVPPPVIATNRSTLASLVATNVLGQHTGAIAATDAAYAQMWAQDVAAMYGYASAASAATRLSSPTPAPATTSPSAPAAQAAAVGHAAADTTAEPLAQFAAVVPQALRSLAAPAAAAPSLPSLASLSAAVEAIPKLILPSNDVIISVIMGLALYARGLTTPAAAAATVAAPAAARVVGGSAAPAVAAGLGRAGLVSGLSVPPSWLAATPAITMVAAALPDAGAGAAPAISSDGLVPGMAAGALAGRALAAGGTSTPGPARLTRAVAELAQHPDNPGVQHWYTDREGLERLLAKLSGQPGIHAVHLSADS